MAKVRWKSKDQIQTEIESEIRASEDAVLSRKIMEEAPARVDNLEIDSMATMMAVAETYEKSDSESLALMVAVAESYEQMYNENMSLMLAVAEMYEEILLLKGGTE